MGTMMQQIAIWTIPVLFAITVHEVAHGWVARQLGDPTAWMMGRLTLNPVKHIDPVGTILVPLVLLLLGGFVFGWAKPVPVNYRNLHNPRRDMALVAVAGPTANLLMALGWAVIMKLGLLLVPYSQWVGLPLVYMGQAGIAINVILMVLNLLPVPPLDGGRVLAGLVPPRLGDLLDRIEPWGLFILVALLATGILGMMLGPPYQFLMHLIHRMFGLPL
ncbi:MAG: site-2 protease family protein [Gammaproteobacteria bacterium]|nr:MAG: site-2 protease family protein [Gammaproteobacteria bacterium]